MIDRVIQETRKLPVKLTEHETAERGKAMAVLLQRAADVETRKKDVTAELNESIASAYEQAAEHAKVVNAGQEDRDVEVELQHDFSANRVTVVRLDNGEVVEERAMTAHEREELEQIPLAVEVVPSCSKCGHLEDVHAEVYVSPAGDKGDDGHREVKCSIDGCRCSRIITEVGVPAIKVRRPRKPSGKHAAAGEGASA